MPIDARSRRDLGVTFEPASCERALGHHRQAVFGGIVDRGGDQRAAESVAFELLGYLGVDQDQAIAVTPVGQLGAMPVNGSLETPGLRIVDDLH